MELDETYLVHEGDVVMFAIDSDGNDSYDGGRLEVEITEEESEDEEEKEKESEDEKPEEESESEEVTDNKETEN